MNTTGPQYVEEGDAFVQIVGRSKDARPAARERFDVVVVGAGQAGLSVGHYLSKTGARFVILDAEERIGDVWRRRWDTLRLFTPAKLDGLPGMRFPAHRDHFPTKDEMADYLESYAARFALPVRSGSRVTRIAREDGRYVVSARGKEMLADRVVVAMADYQKRRVPPFASELRQDVVQIHSSEYRNLGQLRPGPVLVVGAGNSGAEIALETARAGHRTFLSGRDVGAIPFDIQSFAARWLLGRLVLRVLFHRVLTVSTPIGRKLRPKLTSQGGPLIRTKSRHLAAAGVERVSKTVTALGGLPALEDGSALEVANVVWCTGYEPGFPSWIELPIFDERGRPRHDRGIVPDAPGLYFVGLHFLSALSSAMVHGVSRDAERIVRVLTS